MLSFEPVDGLPEELGAALLPRGDAVALPQEVVVDLVGDDAVLLVLRVLGDELPHPLGHGHELPCGDTEATPCGVRPSASRLATTSLRLRGNGHAQILSDKTKLLHMHGKNAKYM